MTDNDVSRTQRKREAVDLQKIGERLTKLKPNELSQADLPEEVLDAITTLQRIRSNEARRRQLQFIGKLMRRIDIEPVLTLLDKLDGQSAAARFEFHQLERWRERLIAEPDALTEYLNNHPQADRQQLRQQLNKVRKASSQERQKTESRALFRLLREFENTQP